MKYYVEYVTTKANEQYHKWVPSIDYEYVCKNLLESMKGGGPKLYRLGAPFVLTLVACFEANVNDWLIIDTFEKHGPGNYEAIVKGYVSLGLKDKYRIAISVMTDNAFQVREDCKIVIGLDARLFPSNVRTKI